MVHIRPRTEGNARQIDYDYDYSDGIRFARIREEWNIGDFYVCHDLIVLHSTESTPIANVRE